MPMQGAVCLQTGCGFFSCKCRLRGTSLAPKPEIRAGDLFWFLNIVIIQ